MGVSEKLNNREVFRKTNWYADESFDRMSKDVIDKHVRRLVLAMKCIEASGREPLDKIERCVIRAFETAEFMYYGLDERELRMLVEREDSNVKGRKRSR